jgi:hypothetical protein
LILSNALDILIFFNYCILKGNTSLFFNNSPEGINHLGVCISLTFFFYRDSGDVHIIIVKKRGNKYETIFTMIIFRFLKS